MVLHAIICVVIVYMTRIAIITSRATSLMNVARDIAYVVEAKGYTPLLLDYMVPASSLKMISDAVIVVMTMNPLIARSWLLLSRDAKKLGIPSFVYTTVEGRLPRRYIQPWMMRDVDFIANSNYTRIMLEQSGLNVIDMVYHGVNFQEIEDALKFKKQARKFIEEKLGKGVYFGTVVSGHPRKGLRLYAQVVKQVAEKNKEAKFYILTTNEALPIFAGVKNVVIDKMFGKRRKIEVLALISAFDYYVQPSLAEGFCLPPGSPVITINGIKSIEEIKEGDLVLTHEGRFRKVVRTTRRHHKGKIVKLVIWNNRAFELKLTPEHPVLAVRRPKRKWRKPMGYRLVEGDVEIEWVPACKIKKGDIVLFPIPKQLVKVDVIDMHEVLAREGISHEYDEEHVWLKHGYSPNTEVSYSKIAREANVDNNVVKYVFEEIIPMGKEPRTVEHRKVIEAAAKLGYVKHEPKKYPRYIRDIRKLARLLGYYVAEGSIGASNHAVELSFGGDEEDLVNDVVSIVKELFNDDVRIYRRKDKNVVRVVLCGMPYVALARQCGIGARDKRIPPWILYGDVDVLKEFIDAYLKGDGSVIRITSKNKVSTRVAATTVSPQLAVDLKIAFIRLGYKPSVKAFKRKDNRFEYVISAIVENKGVVHSNKAWFVANKYIGFLVADVLFEDYEGIVYNLEVEEDNSYTTPVCVIHNCLPLLEAMALGVPTIHLAYEPLTEFSSNDFSYQVPFTRVEYNSFGEGIEYELHLYDTNAFAETILAALDTFKKKPEVYNDMRAKALKQAKKYDIMKLYPKLLSHLGLK